MTRLDPEMAVSVINWAPGSGSAIQDYRSTDLEPDPNKLFTDSQHWIKIWFIISRSVLCMRTKLKYHITCLKKKYICLNRKG
jgi:hypothetical protein